jgi:hypothetical protein
MHSGSSNFAAWIVFCTVQVGMTFKLRSTTHRSPTVDDLRDYSFNCGNHRVNVFDERRLESLMKAGVDA